MKTTTSKLKQRLARTADLRDKIYFLANQYSGTTAFVLACGESILEYREEDLRTALEHELVIVVKQAAFLLDFRADFHVYNWENLLDYSAHPGSDKPISVYLYIYGKESMGVNSDIRLPIPHAGDEAQKLSSTRAYDAHCLHKVLERPWGPGTVEEVVFYLALHLGVKRIATLGWDLSSLGGYRHFYDTTRPDLISRIPFFQGPLDIDERERASADIYHWLQSRDIELVSATKGTLIADCIPRVALNDLLSR
jgi:hypothetical protein